MYCSGYGNQEPTANCSTGYYCAANATSATPTDGQTGDQCPVGSYCPEGTAQPFQCPPGTYTATLQNDECLLCEAGHYCLDGETNVDCPAGYYCPEGTGHVWESCPAGTFSAATGLANETQCTQCTGGFYCDTINATAVTGPCDAGYYCLIGSDTNTPSGLGTGSAGTCPAGHYCPQQTDHPNACPAGTFNNQTGVASESGCHSCPDGYYCELPGLEAPSGLCQSGYYCSGTVACSSFLMYCSIKYFSQVLLNIVLYSGTLDHIVPCAVLQ